MKSRLVVAVFLCGAVATTARADDVVLSKLGPLARKQAGKNSGSSPVIIRAASAEALDSVDAAIHHGGGVRGRKLHVINARAAIMPNAALNGLTNNPHIGAILLRPARARDDGADRGDDWRGSHPPDVRIRRVWCRRRDHRLRCDGVARRSRRRRRITRLGIRRPGQRTRSGVRRLRPRHARGGNRRRQRLSFQAARGRASPRARG